MSVPTEQYEMTLYASMNPTALDQQEYELPAGEVRDDGKLFLQSNRNFRI